MNKSKKALAKILVIIIAVLLFLLVWQIAAWSMDSQILLPGVHHVLARLFDLFSNEDFFDNIISTVSRAFQSFMIVIVFATILGTLAGRYRLLNWFFTPVLTVLKTTPVMSVILLAFIWFKTGTVPIFSAFLMGFPIMYMMMEGAVEHLEEEMNQMCHLYNFTPVQKIRYYIIPTLSKSFSLGAKQTLSMVWKVVVAAEVLTIPKFGVGSKMQFAQIQLETSEVLAWTLIAILLSAIGDLVFYAVEDSIIFIVKKIKEKKAE